MKQSRIEREAARWLIELDTASKPEEQWPEFEEWLRQGPEYEAAFKSMEEAWKAVEELQVFHINHANQLKGPLFTPRRRRPWIMEIAGNHGFVTVAVAVVMALVLGGIYHAFQSRRWTPVASAAWQTYMTDYGEYKRVQLADGSIMQVNTNTLLRVNRASGGREVALDRGEALFDVKKDPDHPFLVLVGKASVTALGTKFAVWRKTDSDAVTVVKEGKVRVTQVSAPPEVASNDQIATIGPDGVKVAKADPDKIDRMLSWERGVLNFQGETLKEAVEAFNRYNLTKLEIDDPTIAGQQIGGIFKVRDPLGFAELLGPTFGIQYVLETIKNSPDQVIHLSRAKL